MKLRPLEDRVIVRKVEAEELTDSGLYIPDVAKERPMEGVVISVGPGKTDLHGILHKPDVKEGDKVLFGKYSGVEIKVDKQEVLILRAEELLAGVEDGK